MSILKSILGYNNACGMTTAGVPMYLFRGDYVAVIQQILTRPSHQDKEEDLEKHLKNLFPDLIFRNITNYIHNFSIVFSIPHKNNSGKHYFAFSSQICDFIDQLIINNFLNSEKSDNYVLCM